MSVEWITVLCYICCPQLIGPRPIVTSIVRAAVRFVEPVDQTGLMGTQDALVLQESESIGQPGGR